MITADNAARWLLNSNDILHGGDADGISNLKLQKLLYYAQGIHLALYDEPLFEDDILAWEHGPVVPSVYRQYKDNGSSVISNFETPEGDFSPREENSLYITQCNFGQFTAWRLRDMTHSETPWLSTEQNDVISKGIIKAYFKENYIE